MIKNREKGSSLYIGHSLFPVFRIELISCMLEARKSRISGLLQILNKADTHYRTDIQRFKGPTTETPTIDLKNRIISRIIKVENKI